MRAQLAPGYYSPVCRGIKSVKEKLLLEDGLFFIPGKTTESFRTRENQLRRADFLVVIIT